MLTPAEREFALIELTLALLDAHVANAIVDSMQPWQEQIVRTVMQGSDAEKREILAPSVTCKCGSEPTEMHPCPYKTDIDSDAETKCNCCEACEANLLGKYLMPRFVPVLNDDGSILLFDIWLGRQWLGSRRTMPQCREAVRDLSPAQRT